MEDVACKVCMSEYRTVGCGMGVCGKNKKSNVLRRYERSGTKPACEVCLSPYRTVGCGMGVCSFEKKDNLNSYPEYDPKNPALHQERFSEGKNFRYHRTPPTSGYKGVECTAEGNYGY